MSDEQIERWSVRRWKQLEALRKLLNECESLDAGNNVTYRIRWLIKEAAKFSKWDHGKRRQSFVQFLEQQARHGYRTRKRKPSLAP